MTKKAVPPAVRARRLVRAGDRAALATRLRADCRVAVDTALVGAPYASLVLTACAHDATPLLLISDLSEHARNIAADPRVSLLYDGTASRADPLTGARATILGRAERVPANQDDRLLARFVARHPGAARYAEFTDFALHRVVVSHVHVVAGFGAIDWLSGADMLYDAGDAEALAVAEADILAAINETRREVVARIAGARDDRNDGARDDAKDGWVLTGIDPEGVDLRRGARVVRRDFTAATDGAPVRDAADARAALTRLTRRADI